MRNIKGYLVVTEEILSFRRQTTENKNKEIIDLYLSQMLDAAMWQAHSLKLPERIKLCLLYTSRFVIEIGRAVDVIHFHTRGNARDRVTVHFTRMDYDHKQAIMLHGKFCEFIQQVGNILRFRLSRLRVVVKTVERVEDNDAAATRCV